MIRQRPPTPLCRVLDPYRAENSETGRYSMESLTSGLRVREQPGLICDIEDMGAHGKHCGQIAFKRLRGAFFWAQQP